MDQTALPSSLDPFFSASLIHQNSAGTMHTIADFCVVPMGVTASVSQYVAECQRVLEKSGLSYTMHAYGTNIEGEWDDVCRVMKECHEAVHNMGCPRVSTSVRIGTRTDKVGQTIQDKVRVVQEILANDSK
ncbi:sll0230 protein [Mortierella sp. GBAus27b]|nr:sll0230 protein [Mortierella sp. GBAus27b]